MFGEYTPLMKPGLLQSRLRRGRARIDPEMGLEKFCPHCQEFWPQDTLFWTISRSEPDGLQCWCRACQLEYKNARRNAA
ncbi:hypothetical protein [Vibrio quintilis]|uniref:Uncharacterized protein n=1 Tax=Vibrio quintilis TaxID=1117707 RepID=A0A1M7Z1T2_9VIBR|nr:hypothetical protein [Vibrio quintilis]SHO58772.1 hypothetical protein VQ7734_04544 [Vibrio quintilis]